MTIPRVEAEAKAKARAGGLLEGALLLAEDLETAAKETKSGMKSRRGVAPIQPSLRSFAS